MKRLYESVILEHYSKYDQMAFLSGPRQIGKTTVAQTSLRARKYSKYLNWDIVQDRSSILAGYGSMLEGIPLGLISTNKPLIVLDEIHKYKQWKNWLKGFSDSYKGKLDVLVTGSSKLNIFRRGGDSLMGRYFLYRVHPLSVAELLRVDISSDLLSVPRKIKNAHWDALYRFGGYPEPFLKQEQRFYHRWQNLRLEQLFKEDIRNLTQVQDLAQMELLAYQLRSQAGRLLNYTGLANKVRVSDQTVRRWIHVMESFYYCFTLPPFSGNVARSLLKEPKVYLWDWSLVDDPGARVENFVASHLFKAVHFWNDIGFGSFALHFLRDKEKREVDFLITKNRIPWVLIEVKTSEKEPLSEHLLYFQRQLKPELVLQLAFHADYVDFDCSTLKEPAIVPMKTFLAQLV